MTSHTPNGTPVDEGTRYDRIAFFVSGENITMRWVEVDSTGAPPRTVDGYGLNSDEDAPIAVYRSKIFGFTDAEKQRLEELSRIVENAPADEAHTSQMHELRRLIVRSRELVDIERKAKERSIRKSDLIQAEARRWKDRAIAAEDLVDGEHTLREQTERQLAATEQKLEERKTQAAGAVERAMNRSRQADKLLEATRRDVVVACDRTERAKRDLARARTEHADAMHDAERKIADVHENALRVITSIVDNLAPAESIRAETAIDLDGRDPRVVAEQIGRAMAREFGDDDDLVDASIAEPPIGIRRCFGENDRPTLEVDTSELGSTPLEIVVNGNRITWQLAERPDPSEPDIFVSGDYGSAGEPWVNIDTRNLDGDTLDIRVNGETIEYRYATDGDAIRDAYANNGTRVDPETVEKYREIARTNAEPRHATESVMHPLGGMIERIITEDGQTFVVPVGAKSFTYSPDGHPTRHYTPRAALFESINNGIERIRELEADADLHRDYVTRIAAELTPGESDRDLVKAAAELHTMRRRLDSDLATMREQRDQARTDYRRAAHDHATTLELLATMTEDRNNWREQAQGLHGKLEIITEQRDNRDRDLERVSDEHQAMRDELIRLRENPDDANATLHRQYGAMLTAAGATESQVTAIARIIASGPRRIAFQDLISFTGGHEPLIGGYIRA